MADYTSGSGGSVSGVSYTDPQGAASLERYVYGILARLEEEENNLTRVSDRTDRITISANLSTKTAAIDLLLNVIAAIGVGGIITYTASHYLTGSHIYQRDGRQQQRAKLGTSSNGSRRSAQIIRTRPQ